MRVDEIDNSLEYFWLHASPSPWNAAMYVLSKSMLGTVFDRQAIIDYWNGTQQLDGSWQTGPTEALYPTQRTLMCYFYLNARPQRGMDAFFSKYGSWQQALGYDQMLHPGTGLDGRDIYHIVYPWCVYYLQYPPWLNTYFNEIERDLSWTYTRDFHRTTHVLYTYVVARRTFPSLDSILDEIKGLQSADGHWEMEGTRPIYSTSIAITLLSQILKLYPGWRTEDITATLDKSKPWIQDSYRTQILDVKGEPKTCGYFGDDLNIEDAVFSGILNVAQTGLLPCNVDMTFSDLVNRLQEPCISPIEAGAALLGLLDLGLAVYAGLKTAGIIQRGG